jgi:hypothetical protein
LETEQVLQVVDPVQAEVWEAARAEVVWEEIVPVPGLEGTVYALNAELQLRIR